MSLDILVNMRYLSNSLSWEVSYETNRGIVSIYVYQRRFCRFLWSRLRQRIRLHDQSGKSEQSESSGWRHRFLQGSLWWIQKQERLLSGRHSLSVRAWKKEQGKELLCKSVQIRLCACMPSQRDLNYHNYKPLISLIVFTAVTSAWPPIFLFTAPSFLYPVFAYAFPACQFSPINTAMLFRKNQRIIHHFGNKKGFAAAVRILSWLYLIVIHSAFRQCESSIRNCG